LTDLALIQQTLAGNTSCFEQLVFRYEKQLMRFLKLRCNCASDAEDIFQETFISAHRYLHSFDQSYAFSTWLFNISLNLIKKQFKSVKETYNQQVVELSQQEDSTESNFSNTDNIWTIAKTHLSDEQLSLLWFTYVEGYTGQEVATVVERSLPWVKINLIRVKKVLKSKLLEQDLGLSDLVRG